MNDKTTPNLAKAQNFNPCLDASKRVSAFVAEHFWQSFPMYTSYDDDMQKQVRGIDLAVMTPGKRVILVDEKLKNYGHFNEVCPFWSSLELWQTYRDGTIHDGWFLATDHLTTHYAFEYAFADSSDDIKAVLLVMFSRADVAYAIDPEGNAGVKDLARRHYDGDRIHTTLGWLKFRKSVREQAFVLNVTLDQLMSVASTRAVLVEPGRATRLDSTTIRELYTA